MRDVNKLLFKNQQDDAIKQIANSFGKLLRAIVDTIDKYGLKTWHLAKHKKDVNTFFKNLEFITTENTEIQTMIKRFFKYRDTLFTFLNLDGIPWNNNNAEHAIKLLATHTNSQIKSFSSRRIGEYLQIMSVYQSCAYNNGSFLKFLLSEMRDLDEYFDRHF